VKYLSNSVQNTIDIGKNFSKNIQGGTVVALVGDLGAGKTAFSKGVALGLGVTTNIVSPTFVLCCEYFGSKYNLVHIDAYRLKDINPYETGIFEKIDDIDNIIIVEWAEYLNVVYHYKINIITISDSEREISIIKI